MRTPVVVTQNGDPRTVLISAREYKRLKQRDRQVIAASEVSEGQVTRLREARMPDGLAALDAELKGWMR